MVTRERLNKFIRKRCHEISHQVAQYCATRDPEALHILRVEVKKLRACLALMQGSTPKDHLHAKGLKDLYKTAGEIRTAQINLKILQDLHLENPAFSSEQHRIIEETSAAFCEASHRYRHKIHNVQDRLEDGTRDIKPEKVKTLFAERISRLSAFFASAAPDTAGLHNARKETKELLYIHALLPPALAASLGVNKDYLDQVQHKIGHWHDNTVTQQLLQGFGQADPSLVGQLQQTELSHLQEIKDLTTGFRQKIHTVTGQVVNNAPGSS
jgi:CHAD domain-containing protein